MARKGEEEGGDVLGEGGQKVGCSRRGGLAIGLESGKLRAKSRMFQERWDVPGEVGSRRGANGCYRRVRERTQLQDRSVCLA